MKRTSVVKQMKTTSVTNSSIYNIGDTHKANLVSKSIALQKEGSTFQGDLDFDRFSLFKRQANLPQALPNVRKKTIHHDPNIYVQNTSITAVSASSILHVGNINHLSAESRVKHFRILLDESD